MQAEGKASAKAPRQEHARQSSITKEANMAAVEGTRGRRVQDEIIEIRGPDDSKDHSFYCE